MIQSGSLFFHDALRPIMTPIEMVSQHPKNPNEGDVEMIADAMARLGVYKGITAQFSTGYILEGNHRYLAMLSMGCTEIPVTWLEVSDEDAMRILLADNRTAEVSQRDPRALERILLEMDAWEGGLTGTGYDTEDLAALARANRAFDHMPINPAWDDMPIRMQRHRVIVDGYEDGGRFDAADVAEAINRLGDLGYHAIGDVHG